MVSFIRLILLSLECVLAIRLTVRDLADSGNAIADFQHCKKSCAPITTLAGDCASESCLCPTVITRGAQCVTCLSTRNVTLAEEINETFQECLSETLPTTLASSDKCAPKCKPLFKKLAACKLSDTCVCSSLESDSTCHKCLLKHDPKTVTTTDIQALAKSCALPYSPGKSYPHSCDYTCLNVYLAMDTCLSDDYACLCSAGQSTRKVGKKPYTHGAFQWGTGACQKCVGKLDKPLASTIKSIQNVCGPPVSHSTVTSVTKVVATKTVHTTKIIAKTSAKTIATGKMKTTSHSSSTSVTTPTGSSKALYPRLIVPVQASSPSKSFGTQYITTVDAAQEVVVVFDIPYGAQHTCDLTFHLPGTGANPGSGTSSYKLIGSKVAAYELASEIKETATYDTLPLVTRSLGEFSLKEGSSSTLTTGLTCIPGTAISIKLVSVGSTSITWFEDYNPPAVGIVLNQH